MGRSKMTIKLVPIGICYGVAMIALITTGMINKMPPFDVGVLVSLPLGLISGYALGCINWKVLE